MSQLSINLGPSSIAARVDGVVQPTDNNALFKTFQDGIVTDFSVKCRYERDGHIYMLGLTSPNPFQGASVAFVQLSSPTLLFIADWTACKVGSCPEYPDSVINDPNWVLLDDHIEPPAPGLVNNGVDGVFRLSGCYIYGHKNPASKAALNASFPLKSWMLPQINRTIPPSKALPNLLVSPSPSTTVTGIKG